MYTEEEARKKWCPQVRVSDGEYYAAENRSCQAGKVIAPTEDINWNRCLASECMMWRWVEGEQFGFESEKGYCGLAGKP